MKRVTRWATFAVLGVLLVYVGYVVWFEARLAYVQPMGPTSLVIATFNEDNERHERVLRLAEIDGNNYIAVNHWPRLWYWQALRNPEVEVKMPGSEEFERYRAVPLEGEERARVEEEYSPSLEFRFKTGFPPRRFLRLDRR